MRVPLRFFARAATRAAFALTATLTASSPAHARTPVIRGNIDTGTIGGSVGFDPTWIATLHYTRGLSLTRMPDRSRLVASLGFPVTMMGYAAGFRLTGGWAERLQAPGKKFGVVITPRTGLTVASDPTGRKTAWTLGLGAAPGYYARGFTFAASLAWRTTLATHYKHSKATQQLFEDRYPEGTNAAEILDAPDNGWVNFGAHHLRGGLVTGWSINNTVQLWLRGGVDYQPGNPYVFFDPTSGRVPFFGNIGVGYRW